MPDAALAARGVYKPRRPQASPLFRLVSDHLHRLQTVYDERFAREYWASQTLVDTGFMLPSTIAAATSAAIRTRSD